MYGRSWGQFPFQSSSFHTHYFIYYNKFFLSVFKGPKKKLRAKIIEYYVEVATECYDKGNFNSAMAIIGEDDLVVIE